MGTGLGKFWGIFPGAPVSKIIGQAVLGCYEEFQFHVVLTMGNRRIELKKAQKKKYQTTQATKPVQNQQNNPTNLSPLGPMKTTPARARESEKPLGVFSILDFIAKLDSELGTPGILVSEDADVRLCQALHKPWNLGFEFWRIGEGVISQKLKMYRQ